MASGGASAVVATGFGSVEVLGGGFSSGICVFNCFGLPPVD